MPALPELYSRLLCICMLLTYMAMSEHKARDIVFGPIVQCPACQMWAAWFDLCLCSAEFAAVSLLQVHVCNRPQCPAGFEAKKAV